MTRQVTRSSRGTGDDVLGRILGDAHSTGRHVGRTPDGEESEDSFFGFSSAIGIIFSAKILGGWGSGIRQNPENQLAKTAGYSDEPATAAGFFCLFSPVWFFFFFFPVSRSTSGYLAVPPLRLGRPLFSLLVSLRRIADVHILFLSLSVSLSSFSFRTRQPFNEADIIKPPRVRASALPLGDARYPWRRCRRG